MSRGVGESGIRGVKEVQNEPLPTSPNPRIPESPTPTHALDAAPQPEKVVGWERNAECEVAGDDRSHGNDSEAGAGQNGWG
jgi:hypothetical protein